MTAAAKANGTAQTGAVAAKDQTDPSTEAQAARRGAGFMGLGGFLSFLGGLPVWRSLRTRRSVSMSRLKGLGSAAGRGGREAFGGFAGFLGFKDRLLVRSDARHTPILIRAWHQAAAAAGVIFLALGLGLAVLTGPVLNLAQQNSSEQRASAAELERRNTEIRLALSLISQQLTARQSALFDTAAMERGLIFVDSNAIDIDTLLSENERLLSTLDAALSLTDAPLVPRTATATAGERDEQLASLSTRSGSASSPATRSGASSAAGLATSPDLSLLARELDLSENRRDLLEAELLIERQTLAKMATELSTARQLGRQLEREQIRLNQSLAGRDDTIAVLKRDLISLQTGQTDGDAARGRALQLLNGDNESLSAELQDVRMELDQARLRLKSMDARLSQSKADNLRLSSLVDQRDAQIASLTEAQNDILDQLEAKVEGQMAAIQKAIDLTGVNQDTTLRLDSLIDSISSPFWNGMGGQIDDSDTYADSEVMEFAVAADDSTLKINGVLDRVLHVEKLSEELQMKRDHFAALPTRSPVRGLRLSSSFGMRKHPISGKYRKHQGLDFAGPSGSPVLASAAGRVVYAARKGTYGNLVEIDHGNGVTTRYAHLRKITVSKGEQVKAGEKLGEVGSTGASTGPHLHWEVRIFDQAKDPQPFLDAGRLF